MLKIIRSMKELDFAPLMQIYEEGNRENGAERYPQLPENQQILCAEQDFYAFLREFFRESEAFYAIWLENGVHTAALRMEPYRDGLLLEALETMPDLRRRGYARALINETMAFLRSCGGCKIYSHVHKKNKASLAVHEACGFQRTLEYAVYINGNVNQYCCVYSRSATP